jgi:hypothetical protein
MMRADTASTVLESDLWPQRVTMAGHLPVPRSRMLNDILSVAEPAGYWRKVFARGILQSIFVSQQR